MVGNYNYAFGLPVRISQKRLRNYFAIVACDHRGPRDHSDSHGDHIVAGVDDNILLDSATDGLIASLTNFICSDLSSPVQ